MTASFNVLHRLSKTVVRIMVAGSLVGLLLQTVYAQQTPPTAGVPATAPPDGNNKAPVTLNREEWDKAIVRGPQGKKGCFKATYPSLEWHEVTCTTAPNRRYPPVHGQPSQTVGNGNDLQPK